MKKNNQKGFLLTEILIVSTVVIGVLLFLFIQFRGINQKHDDTSQYNSVEALYAADALRAFYYDDNYEGLINYYQTEQLKFLDLTDCPASIFTKTEYCTQLISKLNVKQVLFTDADLSNIISALDSKALTVEPSLEQYIRTISNSEGGNKLKYRLIVELDGESFGTINIGKRESSYKVTFHPAGGEVRETMRKVKAGEAIGELPIPTKEGFTFDGWYLTDSEEVIDSSYVPTDDVVLHAKWL